MTQQPTLIIDFDSTFVTIECLDELAAIALHDRPDRQQLVDKIAMLTNLGMEGKITFQESLSRRLSAIRPSRTHVQELNGLLQRLVSPSIARHRAFFSSHADSIYIISGGFKEFILPTAKAFGIADEHILANTFKFDTEGNYYGYDLDNPLAQSGGKVAVVRQLDMPRPIYVVGDGFSDWEIRREGAAYAFIAYIENVRRESVVAQADAVAQNFDNVLDYLKIVLSTAKSRASV